MNNGKALITSWTFWFGALQIALAGVGFFSGIMTTQEASTLFVTGITSIGLRAKTSEPVGSIF